MRIKSVHLSNYKRFTDLTIEHIPESARLVVLIGPNGSGKSSLFDAFLTKASAQRNNYSISGTSEFAGYYNKSHTSYSSTAQVANTIDIKFHSQGELSPDRWTTAFNIRTAYRNEADFRLSSLEAVRPSHETNRFSRIIDPDQSVSDNYKRLAWKRLADLDKDAPSNVTFAKYREEFLDDMQQAMHSLFACPTLKLQDFGGIQEAGAFRFTKGNASDFHYKNLSGGEKAAFDILLDIFVKREEYKDAIYCIDEPELHVNTSLHGKLLIAMLQLIPEESQLWIATHSAGFTRQAYKLMKEHGNVVFLDFTEHDFDNPVSLTPRYPNRSFWQNTYKVALDDLADLITPENIVICEGSKSKADKGFDADCYNRLFSDTHPETVFISYGSSSEVENSQNLMTILGSISKGIKVYRLIDRDDMTEEERTEKIQNGVRVLRRRELENYLYDPEVLRTFLNMNNMECLGDNIVEKRNELLDDAKMPDDLKYITQGLFEHIRTTTRISTLGRRRENFAISHLIPALKKTPSIFQYLLEDIFTS